PWPEESQQPRARVTAPPPPRPNKRPTRPPDPPHRHPPPLPRSQAPADDGEGQKAKPDPEQLLPLIAVVQLGDLPALEPDAFGLSRERQHGAQQRRNYPQSDQQGNEQRQRHPDLITSAGQRAKDRRNAEAEDHAGNGAPRSAIEPDKKLFEMFHQRTLLLGAENGWHSRGAQVAQCRENQVQRTGDPEDAYRNAEIDAKAHHSRDEYPQQMRGV